MEGGKPQTSQIIQVDTGTHGYRIDGEYPLLHGIRER